MKKLTINIVMSESFGRYGIINYDGAQYITCEREYRDNQPFISSIPPGLYKLVPHNGTKYQDTFALVNHDLGVYHWPSDRPGGKGRYACVLHWSKWPQNLEGCISAGYWFDTDIARSRLGLDSSRVGQLKSEIRSAGITHIEILDRHFHVPKMDPAPVSFLGTVQKIFKRPTASRT